MTMLKVVHILLYLNELLCHNVSMQIILEIYQSCQVCQEPLANALLSFTHLYILKSYKEQEELEIVKQ